MARNMTVPCVTTGWTDGASVAMDGTVVAKEYTVPFPVGPVKFSVPLVSGAAV